MTDLVSLLEELCLIDGISGDEGMVRDRIIELIGDRCSCTTDRLGNLIVSYKGRKAPKNKVMVSAHMDEVGFIVTYITDEGFLKLEPVGGVDPRVLFGRRVRVGRNKLPAAVGAKPVHKLSGKEKDKAPDFDEMYADIGAQSREEAQEYVSLGDSVMFEGSFLRFGNGLLSCKAIDDRVGCAVMLKLILDGELEYDTVFTFVVQEEIGLRGSRCAAYAVNPDYALVLEATTAADIPSASGEKRVCEIGKGPVVSFMDRRTVYDKGLYRLAFETAEKNGIPCQTKTMVAGGNDAGAIHLTRGGVSTAAISLPCRYLHSSCCVIGEEDLRNTYTLTKLMLDGIYNR